MFRGGSFKEIIFHIYADLKKTIEGEVSNANLATQTYADETVKPGLDNYVESISKISINDYVTDEKKSELDTYITIKKGELDTYESAKETELDSYRIGTVEPAIVSYITNKKNELDTYKEEKIEEINSTLGTLQETDLTDDYTGNSSESVASQKAVYDGLATKQTDLENVNAIELTANKTGDRNSYIDFHSDDTNADYSARIIRAPGESGNLNISNLDSNIVFTCGTIYKGTKEILYDNGSSLSTNGYQKLSNGLIIQWGYISSSYNNSGKLITFPTAFSTACRNVTGQMITSGNWDEGWSVYSVSTSKFYLRNSNGSTVPFYWFAIGY